jgi:hypothetical protein
MRTLLPELLLLLLRLLCCLLPLRGWLLAWSLLLMLLRLRAQRQCRSALRGDTSNL